MLFSIVLMTLDHRQHHLEAVRTTLNVLVYPLQYVVNLPFALTDWGSETLVSRERLIEENRQLKQLQLQQDYRLQKLASLETENRRLRNLLQSAQRDWGRVLIGELIEVDSDPFKRQVVINKGSRDGVFVGHPMLDANGVMGQVIHVTPFNSTAMLLTDPSHAIPVQVNRNGQRAIALGTGEANHLEIPHIPNNADIRVGDLLVTSGLGRRFPAGYPVATITAVEKDPTEPYAVVSATPTASLDSSQEVLLVWPPDEEDKP